MDKKKIDLTPKPVILSTLGEINLEIWQCLAEFIDNSVDGFIAAKNNGTAIAQPTVNISIPKKDNSGAFVSILDNGPGMEEEEIVDIAKAGYSSRAGSNKGDFLGLWGMGLNVASARLGKELIIMSVTQTGKHSAVIVDLESMERNNEFIGYSRKLTKEEITAFPTNGGTLIKVNKLKPEMRKFFHDSQKRKSLKEDIGRAYSTMLVSNDPLSLCIKINENIVFGHKRLYWRQEDAIKGVAYVEIKPQQGGDGIRGWIGLQRYGHDTDFGIDFVRNGRKIETNNKDLFYWDNDGNLEKEYPIDDPRGRGRIIGEIHLDNCGVPFSKDHFHRLDPIWGKMLEIVKGGADFPLRKNKAKKLKNKFNISPLGKIYDEFRRISPSSAEDREEWMKLLSFPLNDKFVIKGITKSPSDWKKSLGQEVDKHIKKQKLLREKREERKRISSQAKSYGKKHFPALYDPNLQLNDSYVRGLVEDIRSLNADNSPIACCVCLRALVEVALKTKINEMVGDPQLIEALLLKKPYKKQYEAGLGELLGNISDQYAKKESIFNNNHIDAPLKAFANQSSRFRDFLNSITHGNIISGTTHADDFASECSLIVERLLTLTKS